MPSLRTMLVHDGPVTSCNMSPGGLLLGVGTETGATKIIHLRWFEFGN